MTDPIVSEKSQLLAQALLLEQVQFYKKQLTTEFSDYTFRPFIQLFLQHAPHIQLKDVIELEQIQAVVKRYAFEMQLGSGLLEFIGEIAQKIYLFSLQSPIQLQDLLSDYQFEIWLTKLVELDNIRTDINQFFKSSPSIQQLCQYIATTTLHSTLSKHFTYINTQSPTSKYEWQQKLKRFSQQQQQRIEQKIEESLAKFIQEQLANLSLLSNADLESLIRTIWEDHKTRTLAEYTRQITSLDVEEFFVMLYEYWKELRQSPFLQDLVLYGVKVFYDFYQDKSIVEVLSAIGIEETDLYNEAKRFAPQILAALNEHQVLEPLLTMILKPFYQCTETLTVIEQHL